MNLENGNKLSFLDITVIILSVYVLAALIIETTFTLQPQTQELLDLIDNIICFIFLYDFFYRFVKAKSKLEFLKWGWIDFISSIPSFDYLRYGRLVRLFRLLRILRAFRSVKYLKRYLFRNKAEATLATVSIMAVLMIIFGSIAILQVETDPQSNIKTAEDAIWWAFTTITTVGYGDKYPITTAGRVVAAFLMVSGVGLFGTFTGFIAFWFLGDKSKQHSNEKEKSNTESS